MKKLLLLAMTLFLAGGLLLAGCGGEEDTAEDVKEEMHEAGEEVEEAAEEAADDLEEGAEETMEKADSAMHESSGH